MLTDYALMLLLLLFMGIVALYRMKIHPQGNGAFFGAENTKAMRGEWCIVIVLVHTPVAYQNMLQDAIGSFAFIGVTFFFMTSAYGLALSAAKNGGCVQGFWRRRLPKVLIPQLLANVLMTTIFMAVGAKRLELGLLLYCNSWLKWLLIFYLIYWIACLVGRTEASRNSVACGLVLTFSLVTYVLKTIGIITSTVWSVEMLGCIWGIALASYRPRLLQASSKRWGMKCLAGCAVALMLGLAYLRFKPVVFWGDYLLRIALGVAIIGFILLLNTKVSVGNRVLQFLGAISYGIYLIHGRVFDLVEYLAPWLSSGPFILCGLMISVALATCIWRLSEWLIKKLHW